MALSDTDRIDIVTEAPNGEIVLSIVAPEGWSDGQRMRDQLTEKLCTYLAYMHSEKFRGQFGGKTSSILVVTNDEPPAQVRQLLDATAEAAHVRIDVKQLPGIQIPPEPPARPPVVRRAPPSRKVARVSAPPRAASSKRVTQMAFGALGVLGGLGGAIYAYSQSSSIALAIYVFLITNYVVARGVADVITDPHKIRRIFYFALLPALSTGILYLAYQQWDKMWLAVLLGLIGGLILNGILAPLFFPRIHREEARDSMERMKASIDRHTKA
jgi:hypothetical protein